MRKLEGLTIVMMGASGGIGSATAMQLAGNGVNMALCSVDGPGLEDLRARVCEKGAEVYAQVVDATSCEQVEQFMKKAAEKFGTLDILINFAGLSVTADLADLTPEQYDLVMNVNVRGMYLSTRAFTGYTKDEKGAMVVNFGSMAAKRPNPKSPQYSAAKAAVNMFTESLSQQLKGRNIRFTTLNPGPADTTFFEGRIPPEKRTRFMRAQDVAELLEFILTRDSRIVYHDVMFESFEYYKG